MAKQAAKKLRKELLAALSANTAPLRDAIRADLARIIELEKGHRQQFEIDPAFFGVSSCRTEEMLLADDWLRAALPKDWFERAEAGEGSWNEMISEELCPWFADCWQAVGGPAWFSPALLFFHGYHMRQYDLENRCWLSSAEAFGE
jgi:hypothetical protein